MERLGIIDIGSNTMRLVVVELDREGHFMIINELKKSARLSEGIDEFDNFTEPKIQEAFFALKSFKNMCVSLGAEKIIAVGTAAVRKAKNRQVLIDKVKKELGIEIQVIDGIEEANYAFQGVVHGIHVEKGLMIDVGGGSTEIVYIEENESKRALSLPFGTFDIKQVLDHQSGDVIGAIDALEKFLWERFEEVDWLQEIKGVPIVGVGGIVRSIAKVDKTGKRYPIKLLHNYTMCFEDMDCIHGKTKGKTINELLEMPGLSRSRADIFHGSVVLMRQLMKYLETEELIVCRGGIREGILCKYLHENYKRESNLFEASLQNLHSRYHIDRNHVQYIYKIVSTMYQEICPNKYDDVDITKIIRISSMLHDSGIDINFYDHNIHSFYVILYSGIYGVSHKELLISAFCALLHFKHEVDMDEFENYLVLLSDRDVEIIQKVGLLMRMAESFDSAMNQDLTELKYISEEHKFTVEIVADEKPLIVLENIRGSERKFKKVFGKELIVKYVVKK